MGSPFAVVPTEKVEVGSPLVSYDLATREAANGDNLRGVQRAQTTRGRDLPSQRMGVAESVGADHISRSTHLVLDAHNRFPEIHADGCLQAIFIDTVQVTLWLH